MFESLIIGWFLSFGYIPQQTECLNQEIVEISPSDMATIAEIGLSATWRRFKLYGSIENYQFFSGKANFYPFRADYKGGVEIELAKGIRIIAEHECDHPVVSGTNGRPQHGYLSQSTRVMVKIEGTTN